MKTTKLKSKTLILGSVLCYVLVLAAWRFVIVANQEQVMASQTSSSISSTTPLVAEKMARLLLFGDLMIDRSVKRQIDRYGQDYLFKELFKDGAIQYSDFDIIGANLEGPFANRRVSTSKSIAFRFDPALIPMLKKYHLTLFNNANNHSYDMGSTGFDQSKENLRRAGLFFYGSQYRVDNDSMIIQKVGDYNIAFIGANDTNSPVDVRKVKELIIRAERDADYTILNIHWGQEYKEISNSRQRNLARTFIDAGVDVIIGHHPHVIQEMEIYKKRPIFYSLGNFVFDQYFSTPTQRGLGVGLTFEDDSISIKLFPLKGARSQVRLLNNSEVNAWKTGWLAKSRLNGYDLRLPLSLTIPSL